MINQLQATSAGALAQAIGRAWGGGAIVQAEDGDGGTPDAPVRAIRVGDSLVWLAGEAPAGLEAAIATAIGGESLGRTEVPPAPGDRVLGYRWVRAGETGRFALHAPPSVLEGLAGNVGSEGTPLAVRTGGAAQAEGGGADVDGGGVGNRFTPAGSASLAADPFPLLGGRGSPTQPQNMSLLLDVPLEITVELGRTEKLIREILSLSAGVVVELDRLAGEPVDVLVNGRIIARGEVVVIDESFGVRINAIIQPAERIKGLF